MRLVILHLTARLREHVRVRLEGDRGAWLWKQLRRAFPRVLGCMLMSNHLHVLPRVVSPRLARASFVKLLGAFARAFSIARPVWERVPPIAIVDASKALTLVRYLALNPPKARIVTDPLAWYWSTHLDLCGAITDPWVTLDDLRPFLRTGMNDVERVHTYVSADPSVHVCGTALPRAARDTEVSTRTLDEILLAATGATRGRSGHHRRRGPTREAFVWLAATQGWRHLDRLAQLCGITTAGIRRILRSPRPASLDAARVVLGDARLMSAARRSIGAPSAASSVAPAPPSRAARRSRQADREGDRGADRCDHDQHDAEAHADCEDGRQFVERLHEVADVVALRDHHVRQ